MSATYPWNMNRGAVMRQVIVKEQPNKGVEEKLHCIMKQNAMNTKKILCETKKEGRMLKRKIRNQTLLDVVLNREDGGRGRGGRGRDDELALLLLANNDDDDDDNDNIVALAALLDRNGGGRGGRGEIDAEMLQKLRELSHKERRNARHDIAQDIELARLSQAVAAISPPGTVIPPAPVFV